MLEQLGYESVLQLTGEKGFQAATEAADVELILISHHLIQGRWNLLDALTNLRNDARTANLPLYVYGPQSLEITRPNVPIDYPGVKYLIYTTDRDSLERQLHGRPSKLTDAERRRPQAGEHAGSRRVAERRLAMGVGEDGPAAGERVDVRRLHLGVT